VHSHHSVIAEEELMKEYDDNNYQAINPTRYISVPLLVDVTIHTSQMMDDVA